MSTNIKLSDEERIRFLNKQIYQPHKFVTCNTHHLVKEYICIVEKCPEYITPLCRDCHTHHPLLPINTIVPKLAQWAKDEWAAIQKDHKHLDSQWKICLVNVNYCLDILKEVKKQIEERSQNIELGVFKQLLAEIYSMFTHDSNNVSVEMLLKNFQRLNQRFELIAGEEKAANCMASSQQREHLRNKVKEASQKTKNFSEKALAFSETLARIIEQKMRGQRRVNRLKQLSSNRIFNLKDLLKEQAKMEQVNELMIEFPKSNKNQKDEPVITEILDKCHNLKSLRINNRNGGIQKYRWRKIILGMEYLKFLKQLVLNIHSTDLSLLTQLFKEKSKAVRQVEKLTLHITDQKDLNVVDVYNFVNTMQLRSLNLTLSRDNLEKAQMLELLKGIRKTTSMSQLPLNQLNLNLNKNKINKPSDVIEITAYFNQSAQNIKQKSIVL